MTFTMVGTEQRCPTHVERVLLDRGHRVPTACAAPRPREAAALDSPPPRASAASPDRGLDSARYVDGSTSCDVGAPPRARRSGPTTAAIVGDVAGCLACVSSYTSRARQQRAGVSAADDLAELRLVLLHRRAVVACGSGAPRHRRGAAAQSGRARRGERLHAPQPQPRCPGGRRRRAVEGGPARSTSREELGSTPAARRTCAHVVPVPPWAPSRARDGPLMSRSSSVAADRGADDRTEGAERRRPALSARRWSSTVRPPCRRRCGRAGPRDPPCWRSGRARTRRRRGAGRPRASGRASRSRGTGSR